MTQEFGGFVANSFGMRSATSMAAEGQQLASSVANGVIGTVNSILNDLSSLGNSALNTALSSIEALGSFHPSTITVNYTPPEFTPASYIVPNKLELGTGGGNITAPPELSINMPIDTVDLPSISGTAPVIGEINIPDAPDLQHVGGMPVKPTTTTLAVSAAPEVSDLGDLTLPNVTAPALRQLKVPVFQLPVLPEFTLPPGVTLPEVPGVVINYDQLDYDMQLEINENPTLLVPGMELIGPSVTPREIRDAVEALRSRGMQIDPSVEQAQIDYATERAALLNADEVRKMNVDQTFRNLELTRAIIDFTIKKDGMAIEAALASAKAAFEAEILRAETHIQLVQAATQLYNARVMAFNVAAETYRTELEAELAQFDRWKAEVEAEVAKAQVNTQLAQNYDVAVRAASAKAELYQAQVQAMFAKVEAYKALMQAVAIKADAARTELKAYSGEVDAYIAGLAGYKAQFEAYSAKVRGVAAQNQIEQTKTQISVAEMAAAGAGAQQAAANMELEAEGLRLLAANIAAGYENTKLKNTIEQLSAQIQADVAKRDLLEWGVNAQITGVKNDAITDNSQAAARYFDKISDSAYRAAEQAMRALLASSQASATAQEAAGRAAASLSQGAYSAIHVSASLQGAGRISAGEERSDRQQLYFSDMLNYSESRIQQLTA